MPEEKEKLSAPTTIDDFFPPRPSYSTRYSYKNFFDPVGYPEVPQHPMFKKDAFPLVIGQPENARMVERILDRLPEARGTTPSILFGPTRGAMDVLSKSDLGPEMYERSTLLGTYSPNGRQISLNPELGTPERTLGRLETLIHELKHAYDGMFGTERDAYATAKYIPKELIEQYASKNGFVISDKYRADRAEERENDLKRIASWNSYKPKKKK